MLSESKTQDAYSQIINQLVSNTYKVIVPVFMTLMCATVTYPLAVRIARKVFKLRGFYAIHLAIAPFLALVHVNILGCSHMYFRIKNAEREFDQLNMPVAKEYTSYAAINRQIMARYNSEKGFYPEKTLLTTQKLVQDLEELDLDESKDLLTYIKYRL